MNPKFRNTAWAIVLLFSAIIVYEAIRFQFIKRPKWMPIEYYIDCMQTHKIIILDLLMRYSMFGLVLSLIEYNTDSEKKVKNIECLVGIDKYIYLFEKCYDVVKTPLVCLLANIAVSGDSFLQYVNCLSAFGRFAIMYYFCDTFEKLTPFALFVYNNILRITTSEEFVFRKEYLISNNIIPKEIKAHFKNEIDVYEVPCDGINMSIQIIGGRISIVLMGAIQTVLSKEQLISCICHEIGHLYYNRATCRGVYNLSITIITLIAQYLCLKYCEKIIKKKDNETAKEKTFRYINIILMIDIITHPINHFIVNYMGMLNEIDADRFSVKHYGKKNLSDALRIVARENENPFDTSYFFNILFDVHPTLLRRLKYIERY